MKKQNDIATGKSMNAPEQPSKTRWVILLGGFLLSLMGGMSYAWGSFVVPLKEQWGWTAAQAHLPFTVMVITFALTMIPAGWLQDRIGPRTVSAAGVVTFLIGYGLSGLIHVIPYPGWLIFSYGFLVGLACGLTYACIAPTARKWYPDRPGFAVSTSVMGFGLAAVVFAPLKKMMIDALGIDGTFLVLALFVTGVSFLGSWMLKNPPEGYAARPRPSAGRSYQADAPHDIPPQLFLRSSLFYMLWLSLAMVIGGGLTAIGLITAYGEIKLHLAPAVAATAISVYSLVNGLGRPLIGSIADRIGTIRCMTAVYIMQAAVFLALPWIAVNLPMLLACSLFLGLGYATTFALFPVIVASECGAKYLGVNYGLVFSAFAVGALTSLTGSWLWDRTGSFIPAFLLAGATTIIGILLLSLLRIKYPIR